MKIWNGYGSEHSSNLVMIGKFREVASAAKAKHAIEQITERISDERSFGEPRDSFGREMIDLLQQLKIHSLHPQDLNHFNYEHQLDLDGSTIKIKTDEDEIAGLLKVMIEVGARVEVFSAHNEPDSKDPE